MCIRDRALVSLFGRWNWWLPALPARLLRVQPSIQGREHVEVISGSSAAR